MAATIQLNLGGKCRASSVCDCRDGVPDEGIPNLIHGGGDRVEFRGDAVTMPLFGKAIEAAVQARWGEIVVRTHGATLTTPEAAAALRDRGVTGVTIPIFSHVSAAHDKIAGVPGSLVAALRALRACAAAGLAVSIEAPILSPRLQSLEEIVRLAHRAVPKLAFARFFVRVPRQPEVLAPPSWTVARPSLTAALAFCAANDIATAVREYDAIPFCAVGHDPEFQRTHRFNPRRAVQRHDRFALGAVCEPCAMKRFCTGPCEGYSAANGDDGLVPFRARPRRLLEQRTTPTREWTDDQRAAASQVNNRVLRPTVNCNQDCPFCSANETTENVIPKADEMLRSIARFGRIGRGENSRARKVSWLSFSGGEPTLSRDLVNYVRAASRLGIEDIELVTNGVLIDSDAKVRPLAEAGVTRAFVSLHAHDELLARRTTSKVGDWERTVRAVHALVAHKVSVRLNHVISSVNYAYLPRFAKFVADEFGDRVGVSFAFVTPQFKALDNQNLVPRISDVIPYLRRAMRILVDRRVSFIIGSRQGIPPCFLGEYVAWSDFVIMSPQAHADDEPQKIRGPKCDSCRFSAQCVGLWRPYAARYGFDELIPVAGEPLSPAAVAHLAIAPPPTSFEERHPELRVPVIDERDLELPTPPMRDEGPRRLPVIHSAPERTVRVALLGSGHQAQRIARALANVRGLTLAGVASPHLLDRDPGPFADVPRDSDPRRLIETVKPDAIVVASATVAHRELVQLASGRALPVLVEKPLARNLEEAAEIVALANGLFVMTAHNVAFTPGVQAFASRLRDGSIGAVAQASYRKRAAADSSDAPRTWSREALYQTLYHAVYVLSVATGSCVATVDRVDSRGSSRPEFVRAELSFADGRRGEIVLDFSPGVAFQSDELSAVDDAQRRLVWRRDPSGETLAYETASGQRTLSVERGNDIERMLEAFREALVNGSPPPVTAAQGRDAMATATAIVDGLKDFIVRPTAPKHAASPSLR